MMSYETISEKIELEIELIFEELRSGISEREDSRAFGAMIEKRITENWERICSNLGYQAVKIPGRRTIFDFACSIENKLFGFDVKTKDLDSTRYSDGGVCAVGNLLKFLANDKGVFMIIEFGHDKSTTKNNSRDIEYIRVAPLHCLPENTYRIENLGTGQVRLNYTINQVWDEIDWGRSYNDFFDIFCNLAITHYKRVKADAEKRIKSIEQFKNGGYQNFRFVR
ncbi:hypothetical protein [Raineya orbicola]|jgi:hypothetical protein|uniref:Restriction endonuclease n=1 Tax=Raineya orbicola TaxID=2016530 RepID=A0A2N3IKZ6_9BACT|nr:hypothetical protein [Raineya orbicola]PKQ70963.1 hypothetical protein Rain11_0104 [Raineya orbicola]